MPDVAIVGASDCTAGTANVPFCLTFDNMGGALDVYEGRATRQADDDAIVAEGFPRILALLNDEGIKATFFIEGWNVLHNTDLVRAVAAAGHDIGVHGWSHEKFDETPLQDQDRFVRDALAAFRLIGIDAVGFRAPGGSRPDALMPALLEMGLGFDSSVDWDEVRRQPAMMASGIASVPILPFCDYYYYIMDDRGDRTPATFQAAMDREMDYTAEHGLMCHLVFHPFISCANEERFAVLEHVVRKAARDPRFRFVTVDDLARALHLGSAGGTMTEARQSSRRPPFLMHST